MLLAFAEAYFQASEDVEGGAGRDDRWCCGRGSLRWRMAVNWTGDEVAAVVVGCGGELAGGVVVPVEQVVHLREEFEVRVECVTGAEIDYAVAGAVAAAEVVLAVGWCRLFSLPRT